MDDLPNTPESARALGLTRYFTGKPCRNGHVAPRRVQDGRCIACKTVANRRRIRRQTETTE